MKKFIISSTVLTILIASTITASFALSNNSDTSKHSSQEIESSNEFVNPEPNSAMANCINPGDITIPYDLEHRDEYIAARVAQLRLPGNPEPSVELLMENGIYLINYMTDEQREEVGFEYISNLPKPVEYTGGISSDSVLQRGFNKYFTTSIKSGSNLKKIMEDTNNWDDNRVSLYCGSADYEVHYSIFDVETHQEYDFFLNKGETCAQMITPGGSFVVYARSANQMAQTIQTQITLDRVG